VASEQLKALAAHQLKILRAVSRAMGDRPVRWGDSPFAYDGHERTVEVFNADAEEQRELRKALRPLRDELNELAGGPLVLIFHTRLQTERFYRGAVAAWEEDLNR
jgi:hypothetical protein